jgi:hypothetical protein
MSLWTAEFTGNGDFIRLSWPFASVAPGTVVMASISELDSDGLPFTGDATVEIHNVAPRSGWVDLIAAVLWDSPLRCRVSFAIFD